MDTTHTPNITPAEAAEALNQAGLNNPGETNQVTIPPVATRTMFLAGAIGTGVFAACYTMAASKAYTLAALAGMALLAVAIGLVMRHRATRPASRTPLDSSAVPKNNKTLRGLVLVFVVPLTDLLGEGMHALLEPAHWTLGSMGVGVIMAALAAWALHPYTQPTPITTTGGDATKDVAR